MTLIDGSPTATQTEDEALASLVMERLDRQDRRLDDLESQVEAVVADVAQLRGTAPAVAAAFDGVVVALERLRADS